MPRVELKWPSHDSFRVNVKWYTDEIVTWVFFNETAYRYYKNDKKINNTAFILRINGEKIPTWK